MTMKRRMKRSSPEARARVTAPHAAARTAGESNAPPRGCQRSAVAGALVVAVLALAPGARAASPSATAPPAASPRAGTPAPGNARAAARALERRLAEVTALVARFTQVVESPALPTAQTESGTLYLARPGRMRWEYSTPPGKLAIADGRRTWLYLPEDRQALSAPLAGPGQDQGIGLLLGGTPDILAVFSPRLVPAGVAGGRAVLALRPRSPDAAYDEVRVETDAGGFPIAIVVNDPLGGRVTYRFEAIRFVPSLDEGLFRFTPPPGVSVQEAGP